MSGCSKPVLANAYLIVINSLLLSHIKWGIKTIKNTSAVIKYLKSNFFSFLINIKYRNKSSIEINR